MLAPVAGTFSLPDDIPPNSITVQSLFSGSNGISHFPNDIYEIYFASNGNSRTGGVTAMEWEQAAFIGYDINNFPSQPEALILRSTSNRPFGLARFTAVDTYGIGETYYVTGYRGGVQVGPPLLFRLAFYAKTIIELGRGFENVDEVRITIGGAPQSTSRLEGEVFDDFVITNPFTNADLGVLAPYVGQLGPTFSASVNNYSMAVSHATTSIKFYVFTDTSEASVKLNGVTVLTQPNTEQIPLAVGANTITFTVTAPDGTTTKTYTVTVTRAAPSANANLAALSLSSGGLSPGFASATTNYTASVGNATTSITATATLADPTARVTINGTSTSGGAASAPIALAVGSNPITVVVTAEDGTTQSYTVSVVRAASANNNLAGLSLSSGSLTPAFSASRLNYSASVASNQTSATVTPMIADSNAAVAVNGAVVATASPSAPIALVPGANTISISVTAQDGSQKTYTVTVNRAAATTTASGSSPTGGGTVTATLAGPPGCGFNRADFIAAGGAPASPPPASGTASYGFSQGLFDVVVDGCPNAAAVTITLAYPQAFAP